VSAAAQEGNVTATRMRHSVVVGLVLLLILLPASHLRAEDALAHAKDLYLSAAYDEALVVLEQLKSQPAPTAGTEVEQYRVFCLLALERSDEARKAIADIVAAEPFYRPSDTQTSPRIRAVFDETRKALLPGLVQRTYADAKASFEKKDPKALSQFELVLTLLDDPDLKGVSQLADLRTVVSGFRDLSKARAGVPPPAAPKPVEAPAPAQAAISAASQAATVVDTSSDRVTDVSLGFTPPVVISQPIPRWVPPNTVDRRSGFKGLIEVTIDENGNVTSATLQQSVHPLYDEKLLAMARTWKYKPAMRNGVPTTSLKVVAIQLQPAR
jgi:TonB family protein